MANYLITGSRNNTPHITSMDDASFNAGVVGNGAYILNRGEKLRAEMTTPNNCRIYDGDIVTQGRHSRIETSSYIDLTVSNGTVGMKRNDLVVARYESDAETGIESVDFVVKQGTPSASNPEDPTYTEGNIFEGDLVAEFPIYRIKLDGITVGAPERICGIAESFADIADYIAEKGTSGIWTYEKYKDGTFKCWGNRTWDTYWSVPVSLPFSALNANSYFVNVTNNSGLTYNGVYQVANDSASQFKIYHFDQSGSALASAASVNLLVIGKYA